MSSKVQLPIDGKFQVTSEFGWRTHPVEGVRKHHNGIDLWTTNENTYIEAPFSGKVIYAGPSKIKKANGEPGGFGYYVQILFNFRGEWYISTKAHMKKGSIKVKTGQKIEAGTVVGIMGATGMVTGRHLHWEITKGKKYVWTNNGKGYIDPLVFTKAAIAFEKINATAADVTPEDAPTAPAPVHGTAQPVTPAPAPKVVAKPKTYKVKAGDSYWAIADKNGLDVKKLQKLNGNKALHPGDTVTLY